MSAVHIQQDSNCMAFYAVLAVDAHAFRTIPHNQTSIQFLCVCVCVQFLNVFVLPFSSTLFLAWLSLSIYIYLSHSSIVSPLHDCISFSPFSIETNYVTHSHIVCRMQSQFCWRIWFNRSRTTISHQCVVNVLVFYTSHTSTVSYEEKHQHCMKTAFLPFSTR